MRLRLRLCLALLLLAGCQGTSSLTPEATPTTPPAPAPTVLLPSPSLPAPSPTPPPTPIPARNTQYILKAKFDYAYRSVSVEEQINYTNNSTDALPGLVLMVEPNNYAGVFSLSSLTWENKDPVRGYGLDANQLQVPLLLPLQPHNSVRLLLAYELQLPEIPAPADDRRPVPFGFTSQQTNLVDWYPTVAPYRSGSGWLAHKPWFYGEHQVYEKADFEVSVEISNAPAGLVVAASAAARQSGSAYSYTHKNARNFILSASPYYKVFTQQAGNVTVTSYAFTFDVTAGKAALQYSSEALQLYSRLFSPYEHASLSVIEADFLDGMEYDGVYFLSKGFYNLYGGNPQGYLAAIAAHETAHQWWYARVANDQALEPWLDEAMCTYTEYIFYKNLYPGYLKWWWTYRVDYYDPIGFVNLQLYDYTSYRAYRDAVYLNGAHFLDDLRTLTGDEAFYAFLKDYADRYQDQIVTGADYFALLMEHTTADLTPLLKKYFK